MSRGASKQVAQVAILIILVFLVPAAVLFVVRRTGHAPRNRTPMVAPAVPDRETQANTNVSGRALPTAQTVADADRGGNAAPSMIRPPARPIVPAQPPGAFAAPPAQPAAALAAPPAQPAPVRHPAPAAAVMTRDRPPVRRAVRVVSPPTPRPRPDPPQPADCWLPDGVRADIAGISVSGGMIYVGSRLPAEAADGPDPALIDPRLPVDHRNPDLRGESMNHWPSYSDVTPAARAAYLRWLAGGRCDPDVYLGYVFLYFYGLERRLLVDGRISPVAAAERASLVAEVRRLLTIYGRHGSFRGYAQNLLDAMAVVAPRRDIGAPPELTFAWSPEPSLALRMALAELSAADTPVPAEWALAWITQLPDTFLRTPATRCPEQFTSLFAVRYRERHGDGLILRPGTRSLSVSYRPASRGIRSPAPFENPRLREVSDQAGAISVLRQLAELATTELEAYSRYLGRHPDGATDSAAIAVLPAALPVPADAAARTLWPWAEGELGDAPQVVSSVEALVAHWADAPTTGKLGRADLVVLAQLLDRQGIGLEPDIRFGGGPPSANKAIVLFRRADQRTNAPSPAYDAALATVNLGMLVAMADGTVSAQELVALRAALAPLDLTADERGRLDAHAALVAANPPTPAVLRRRLGALSTAKRAEAGQLLITIAAADGTITPDEVRRLETLFRDLGLDPNDIYSTLNAAAATTAPSPDDLVTVRTAGPAASRIPLPTRQSPARTAFALDPALLAAKRAESARAAAQLAEIFAEDEPAAEVAPAEPPARLPDRPSVAGLDGDHSRLFHRLVERESWPRAEVERLAADLGLLTDGALEVLNEAAYDRAGGPLWEGTDPLTIDHDIAKDMHE